MRINRTELIKQLTDRIAQLDRKADAEYEAALEKEKAREAEYIGRTGGSWVEYANRILSRTRANQPVLDGDKPPALQREGSFRLQTAVHRSPQTGELKAIVRLLEGSPDETISLASLERAGFSLGRVLK